MVCRKAVVFLFIFVNTCLVLAQHAEEPAAASNAEKDYSGKQSLEWEKAQAELGTIKGKLDAQTGIVKGLLEKKSELKGEALDQNLDELKKEYQKLLQYTDEFNKLNMEYQTKYPERGTKEARIYKRIKPKSLQAMENEMTIQGRVNRLHSKILNQYPKNIQPVKKKKLIKRSDDKTDSENTKKPDEVDVTDQIIFKN